jgi:hypothetical protein
VRGTFAFGDQTFNRSSAGSQKSLLDKCQYHLR